MISVIKGYGSYLPERVVTNAELASQVETSDEWIIERTGIRQRYIAHENELTSHLGAKAAQKAMETGGFSPDDIDLIIVATTTPDNTLPSTATKIQHQLGIKNAAAFDVNAACSGFVYALTIAESFLKSGNAKRALVIGAETFSRLLDWKDRSTCILFGDGAGAFVVEAAEEQSEKRGILYTKIYSDGSYGDILSTTGGVSSTKDAGFVTMNGKEVFRHAVEKMSGAVTEGLSSLGFTADNVDWVVPHQANVRILQAVAKRLSVPEEKLVSSVQFHANTSAASIPLAICQAVSDGRIQRGNLLVLPALGAGLTWGACIIRW